MVDATAAFGPLAPGATATALDPITVQVDAATAVGTGLSFTVTVVTTEGAQQSPRPRPAGGRRRRDRAGRSRRARLLRLRQRRHPLPGPEAALRLDANSTPPSSRRARHADRLRGRQPGPHPGGPALPLHLLRRRPSPPCAVSDNGWISFDADDGTYNFYNWPLPSHEGPGAMVAPFWDNLNPSYVPAGNDSTGLGSSGIFTHHDAAAGTFTVEWSRQRHFLNTIGGLQTFQVVLQDQDAGRDRSCRRRLPLPLQAGRQQRLRAHVRLGRLRVARRGRRPAAHLRQPLRARRAAPRPGPGDARSPPNRRCGCRSPWPPSRPQRDGGAVAPDLAIARTTGRSSAGRSGASAAASARTLTTVAAAGVRARVRGAGRRAGRRCTSWWRATPTPPARWSARSRPSAGGGSLVLGPVWPNPVRGEGTIAFALPRAGTATPEDLRRPRALRPDPGRRRGAGRARTWPLWDGRDDAGQVLPDGVYVYRLQTAGTTLTRKLLVVR